MELYLRKRWIVFGKYNRWLLTKWLKVSSTKNKLSKLKKVKT